MGSNALNSKHKNGTIAELKAALWYEEKGWTVFWPTSTQSPCDFIAACGKINLRIQVKSAYWMKRPSGCTYLQVTIRKGSGGHKKYTEEDCDLVIVVYEDKLWVFGPEVYNKYTTINLENGQKFRQKSQGVLDATIYRVK